MIHRSCLLVGLLMLAGCSDRQHYSIDNPTDQPLTLAIDGDAYEIAPHQAKSITLKSGAHTMRGTTVGDIKFISYVRGRGGIINPTLSDYVVMRQSYEPDPEHAQPYGGKLDTITLDGVPFEGLLEQSNALFIDKNWSYDVDEELPDSVTEHSNGAQNTIRAKVFRSKDFIAYFEKNADAKGYFENNRPKTASSEVRKVQRPLPLPHIDDPAFEDHTGDLRAFYVKYQHATDPAEQEALQKEYNRLVTAFGQAVMTEASKASREVNDQADVFTRRTMALVGSTAIVTD